MCRPVAITLPKPIFILVDVESEPLSIIGLDVESEPVAIIGFDVE